MYKLLNVFTFLFLFIQLFSCSQESTPDDPLKDFSQRNTIKITPSCLLELEDYEVFKPGIIIKNATGYVVKNQTEDRLFSSINFSTRSVVHGVKRGEGPDELVSPSSFYRKDDDFFIYDLAKKIIYKVILGDSLITISEFKRFNMDERPFIINCLANGFVASGLFQNAWMAYFDNDGIISSTLDFPFFEETKNFPVISMSSLYLSTLATVRPGEQKIVCVSQTHGVLSFCNIVGNQLKEYKQIKYYPPKVSSLQKAGSPTIAFSRDNKIGFCGVASDENNVLVLYSGRTFNSHGVLSHHCEHVLIYNWKGEPVKRLILEKPLYSMNYDEKTKTLYGIGYDPETVILEYDLNGII